MGIPVSYPSDHFDNIEKEICRLHQKSALLRATIELLSLGSGYVI
jgi:hypothetical protein